MSTEYNIYCDESCHLENDGQKAMVLGAIKCPKEQRIRIAKEIKAIKLRHNLPTNFEIKWTKVSNSKLSFYLELVNYFFSAPELSFRAIVIADKSKLQHSLYGNSHDDFYYKMYFLLLDVMLENSNHYNVYLDIKDTQGSHKVEKLHEVLANANYDFDRDMIQKIQQVHSHEVEHLQLADLLIGALGYLHRGLNSSSAKQAIIKRIQDLSHLSLIQKTLPTARKFNLLVWEGR